LDDLKGHSQPIQSAILATAGLLVVSRYHVAKFRVCIARWIY